MSLAIADKSVLVTGANRGLGRALVDEALRRGAERVYAASRQPMAVRDERVTPLVGNSQLLIYHFMFGPSYEAGCAGSMTTSRSLEREQRCLLS